MKEDNEFPILDPNDENFKDELAFNMWSTQSCSDFRNDKQRPYDGQGHTYEGIRGSQLVEGLTVRDIIDCLIKGMLQSGRIDVDIEEWRPQHVYKMDWDKVDPLAIAQNFMLNIEKMMGIYPNISQNPQTDKG